MMKLALRDKLEKRDVWFWEETDYIGVRDTKRSSIKVNPRSPSIRPGRSCPRPSFRHPHHGAPHQQFGSPRAREARLAREIPRNDRLSFGSCFDRVQGTEFLASARQPWRSRLLSSDAWRDSNRRAGRYQAARGQLRCCETLPMMRARCS